MYLKVSAQMFWAASRVASMSCSPSSRTYHVWNYTNALFNEHMVGETDRASSKHDMDHAKQRNTSTHLGLDDGDKASVLGNGGVASQAIRAVASGNHRWAGRHRNLQITKSHHQGKVSLLLNKYQKAKTTSGDKTGRVHQCSEVSPFFVSTIHSRLSLTVDRHLQKRAPAL